MAEIDNGGAAFPTVGQQNGNGDFVVWPEPGMSLRDWFAANEDVSNWDLSYLDGAADILGVEKPDESLSPGLYNLDLEIRLRAALRYRIADAMLKAREAK